MIFFAPLWHKCTWFAYVCRFYIHNKYIYFGILCLILFVFIFVFANISPNNRIRILICPLLVPPNIFEFVLVSEMGYNNINICICKKNVNPIILVFIFTNKFHSKYICICIGPENRICHTLHMSGVCDWLIS